MPEHSVKVSFTAPADWRFVPDVVTVKGVGKIILHQEPAAAPWEFVRATVEDGGSQFTEDASSTGKLLKIDDACTATGSFIYTVTVSLAGTTYTSPDTMLVATTPPRIQNDSSKDPAPPPAPPPPPPPEQPTTQPPRIQNDT